MPVLRLDVTGVIPPLGLILRMIEMIAGEFIPIIAKSVFVLRDC
jgi:hypothetical protein